MARNKYPFFNPSKVSGLDFTATTKGIKTTVSALATGDTPGNSFYVTTLSTPANAYGAAGYFDSTAAGTFAGHYYNLGSWINFGASAVTGANIVAAQDNGIYGTATMTSTAVIFGMRMEAILTGTPAAFCPFSLNTDNKAITALFHIASSAAISAVNRTISTSTVATGTVPLFCNADGSNVRYVHYYTSTS